MQEALNQCAVFTSRGPVINISNRICISPQCGFASHSEGNRVSEDDVRKKLTLVVETAKEIWSDF